MPGGRGVLGAVERARIRHALTPADGAALVLHVNENRFPARHAAETRFKRPHQRQSYEREPDRREAHHCMVAFLRVDFRYLAIEGPPGLGKTVLAERLAARLDATVVRDDTENPFLADFYAGRSGSGFQTQLFYTLARHRRLQQLRQGDLFSQTTICDFVFERDRIYAFANLDDNELFIYQRLYDLLARDVSPPDLVIYLQAPTEVLLKRARGRADDGDVERIVPDAKYLQELNEAYHHFFFHYTASPLLVVETSQFAPASSDDMLDDLVRQIDTMGKGTRYYVPRTG